MNIVMFFSQCIYALPSCKASYFLSIRLFERHACKNNVTNIIDIVFIKIVHNAYNLLNIIYKRFIYHIDLILYPNIV